MIICGDCPKIMSGFPENHFDSIVTDPPYGLNFMGKDWDSFKEGDIAMRRNPEMDSVNCGMSRQGGRQRFCEDYQKRQARDMRFYQNWAKGIFIEALRVSKPGTHLLAFGGTRTFHRLTCAIEDAGWEIRDCLMWVYGSGFPKSHNLKAEHEGWGTALKPAWEPIILARKPLEGTVAENVQKWGTGALNIDGCRVGLDGMEIHANPAKSGLGRKGIYGQSTINEITGKDLIRYTSKGRWPANLVHDGSQMVLNLFPETGGGARPKKRGAGTKGYHGWPSGTEDGDRIEYSSGSAARFFYCAKTSRSERDSGLDGEERPILWSSGTKNPGSFQSPNTNRAAKNNHPTVKPLALMRYLCRLVTPPSGLILDPFMGSGTTGMAAKSESFRFLGIDNNLEYCKIARRRIYGSLDFV